MSNLNSTAHASSCKSSRKSVSLQQIKELEEKIARLNEQIAVIMHRSVETQESIVNDQARALKESKIVHSDETLGWKVRFIDQAADASRLFTPNSKAVVSQRSNMNSSSFLDSSEAAKDNRLVSA